MVRWNEKMDIINDYRQGVSIRQLAKNYSRSRETIRRVVRGEHKDKITRTRTSKLDPYKDYLKQRWEEYGLSAKLLHDEITQLGFDGSYDLVQEFIKEFRGECIRKDKCTVRYETLPGKQAQVDWKEFATIKLDDGSKIKLNIFVMILGYSRHTFACFTTSMDQQTLQECHMRAFEYFGGIPQKILYDNMGTVRNINTREPNEKFMQFANYYQFKVKYCRVRRARTKGKVERFIEYIQSSFLPGRVLRGLDDASCQLMHWLDKVANARVHATTNKVPAEELQRDLAKMIPVDSIRPWQLDCRVKRNANYEGFVRYRNSHYSVGKQGAGRRVMVEDTNGHICIYLGDGTLIVEHEKAANPGETVCKKEHMSEMWKLCLDGSELKPPAQRNFVFMAEQDKVETRSLSVYEECV